MPAIIAIGSGKGGVGKSVIAASMGVGFAMLKRKTVVVDADFGGSNLHQIIGIPKPAYTYRDFQSGQVNTLNDIIVDHHQFDNLGLIFGAAGSYGMANEKYFNRQKFIKQLKNIHAEFVVVDLGAGSSFQVLDLFSAADLGIVVMNPEPLSLSESFNFVKQVVIRNLSNTIRKFTEVQTYVQDHAKTETFRSNTRVFDLLGQIAEKHQDVADQMKTCLDMLQIGLILNRVTADEQAVEVEAFQKALRELLSVDTEFLGIIHDNKIVPDAVLDGIPFIAKDSKAVPSRDLANLIIMKVLHRKHFHAFWDKMSLKKRIGEEDFQRKKVICSVNCMYWDECKYRQGGYPCKLQYMAEMGFQGEE